MKKSNLGGVAAALVLSLAIGHAHASDMSKPGSKNAAVQPRYEQVSEVMKQVFSGGDLGPNSRAVKHAADVDMPARGGNPLALKKYLQQAQVHKWYQDNFQLK